MYKEMLSNHPIQEGGGLNVPEMNMFWCNMYKWDQNKTSFEDTQQGNSARKRQLSHKASHTCICTQGKDLNYFGNMSCGLIKPKLVQLVILTAATFEEKKEEAYKTKNINPTMKDRSSCMIRCGCFTAGRSSALLLKRSHHMETTGCGSTKATFQNISWF